MRAEKHVGCVMNERRKHQAESGADESVHVGEQRRNFPSKAFHESTPFALLPPRPQSYTRLSSGGSELLGLQVQGFCCPLQQRPNSGRVTHTHRVTPKSREGGDGRPTLLSSLRGRSRTRSRPEMAPEVGCPTVKHHREPVCEIAETPTTPCIRERPARHGQPGAAKVSELHLYLPSSLCDDEEQDAAAEEMRTSADGTGTQKSEAKPNNSDPLMSLSPSHTHQEQPNAEHLQMTSQEQLTAEQMTD